MRVQIPPTAPSLNLNKERNMKHTFDNGATVYFNQNETEMFQPVFSYSNKTEQIHLLLETDQIENAKVMFNKINLSDLTFDMQKMVVSGGLVLAMKKKSFKKI